MTTDEIVFFWFRRDLRLKDNAGLYHALKSGFKVIPVFIFDSEILDKLEDKADARVTFIHQQIAELNDELNKLGSGILVKYGTPNKIWEELTSSTSYKTRAIYTNHDYEPYAINRDLEISKICSAKGIEFSSFKDQCVFEKDEIVKDDQKPYTVFTPYSKKWKSKLNEFYLKPYPSIDYLHNLHKIDCELSTLESMGFEQSNIPLPSKSLKESTLLNYSKNRDFPAIEGGTSRLGLHLRFGTISVRTLAKYALERNETFLNELIWREFYMMILFHFPYVKEKAFKKQYDNIPWINDVEQFDKWCKGQTGYPIVDAGMRELNATGFMHNRVRMITASFLIKHLLIDWRWGEAYFASKLLDFDLSANNGGWQ